MDFQLSLQKNLATFRFLKFYFFGVCRLPIIFFLERKSKRTKEKERKRKREKEEKKMRKKKKKSNFHLFFFFKKKKRLHIKSGDDRPESKLTMLGPTLVGDDQSSLKDVS